MPPPPGNQELKALDFLYGKAGYGSHPGGSDRSKDPSQPPREGRGSVLPLTGETEGWVYAEADEWLLRI